MSSRLLATALGIICLILLQIGTVYGLEQGQPVVCTAFGSCEACPEDALDEPFCQPFGNRRLVHCVPDNPDPHAKLEGEIPAWESCGRIVEKERADFWEFVACNVAFAGFALGMVYVRSRRMEELQSRQLAARIGIPGTRRGAGD